MLSRWLFLSKGIRRYAVCGTEIKGEPVVRHRRPFCCAWHADQYRPPVPCWKRIFKDPGTPQGTGCG